MVITSAGNPNYAYIKSLFTKKGRKERSAYVVEGPKMVADALRLGIRPLLTAFGETYYTRKPGDLGRADVLVFGDSLFDRLSDAVTPQGVLAVLPIERPLDAPPRGDCVVLDRIRDPGNLGTIIRTAAATGFSDVYLINCADAYNPKTVRSTMSGIFFVNCRKADGAVIDELKAQNVNVVAADARGESVSCAARTARGKTALVIGNEADGIDPALLSKCDRTVGLPVRNVESLNAAVSAGILMYYYKND